jgi:hypothetical protein
VALASDMNVWRRRSKQHLVPFVNHMGQTARLRQLLSMLLQGASGHNLMIIVQPLLIVIVIGEQQTSVSLKSDGEISMTIIPCHHRTCIV